MLVYYFINLFNFLHFSTFIAHIKTMSLSICLARSTLSSPITGKSFTTRYIKKLLRK